MSSASITAEPVATQAPEHLAGRNNLLQLVQLRWLAVAGQLLTIVVVDWMLFIRLPLREMLGLLAALALFNFGCWLRSRMARRIGNGELFAGLLVDVAVFTAQLYFAGGITNPFVFLYLLQVAVGAVLLQPGFTWAMVGLTSLAFIGLTQWYRPLVLPEGGAVTVPPDYVGGLVICFLINAPLLVIFITRIMANLRRRDERLAALRQRAAEEEHILRMGLLASGAAHELGTPLATLSVILGDWARMAPFAAEPELREEIEEMQGQLERCKRIVGSILLSAGEARGDAPVQVSLPVFLDDLVDHWCRTRPAADMRYQRRDVPDAAIISDTALRQMIDNLLDNALEAAPHRPIELQAWCEDGTLLLRLRDHGPGFAPEMLAHFGKPYQSSKGRPGGGLGLFLSVNVARLLGGRIEARNPADGGAEVLLTLPLASLTPVNEDDDD